MRGTLAILYEGDPLPPIVQDAISVACAEAVARVLIQNGFPPDSLLVQG